MVIFDPDMNGCSVINGLKVSYIRGNLDHVINEIIIRTCNDRNYKPKQIIPIAVTTSSIGSSLLIRELEYKGLEVIKIESYCLDNVLPIICAQ